MASEQRRSGVKGSSVGAACGRLPRLGRNLGLHLVGGAWAVVFESDASHGTMPPRPNMLTLASCAGYNASQYGA